ncbi:MAG: family 20 glycosylhydrolase [Lachnospiraceae bacterium]|nr:family 20 glycosylhydrolase [Lachnospiraceae bacterium]
MKKKSKRFIAGILIFFMVVIIGALLLWKKGVFGGKSDNLALQRGVKATCDSMEKEELGAEKAIDGDDENLSSRWSSENNWEDASHYIELEFPEEISVSFVVLKWERTNVTSYQLEGSLDGESWQVLEAFEQAPATKRQEIPLEESAVVKYLRLSTSAVSTSEEDYSNLYQNVSLYEFEVYADLPAAYQVKEPKIIEREDGSRYLEMPQAPEGYQIAYLGADYEQIIGDDMEVYHTIQDKEVEVGFLVEDMVGEEEAQTTSFIIQVPAADSVSVAKANAAPQVIPAIAEWNGGEGTFIPNENSRIIVAENEEREGNEGQEQEDLKQTAEKFADWYAKIMGYEIAVIEGTEADVAAGDFYLTYATADNAGFHKSVTGVGEEGYVCDVSDKCVIIGTDKQGIYWGTITLLQILKQEGAIPQGTMRDYPKYEVRGFGIDVARKPVSMDMLYDIVETMSWYKMNDLGIHLNDNAILSTSGLTDSVEEAMTAYSAFRIDTSVTNESGEQLTSQDYFYTADEFTELIETAETYGVQIVPELDTPAHSLSITKLFPEYALTVRNEAVDQIDLSNQDAVGLVKDIWHEVLNEGQGAFAEADVVNIGMDEYYGDGETYRRYMNEIIELVQEEDSDKTVRLWGSLSNMDGETMPPTENVQMNLWSDIWADPMEMYQAGYSIINMQNNHLYIIPGGGYDYLDTEDLYANWEPNKFYDYNQLEVIPAYSPQMLGAAYMIWNDMCDNLDVGISEYDLFVRFCQPLGVISGKLWGEVNAETTSYEDWMQLAEELGTAPGSNPYSEAVWAKNEWNDSELNENTLTEDASATKTLNLLGENETLSLQGQADYVETDYEKKNDGCVGIGGNYSISMQVYKETVSGATTDEEILFEADSAYGQTAFKTVQIETGQVGFSREGRDYSFDYTLPEDEWVTLVIKGTQNQTSLYVNGELVDTLGDAEPFSEYATFVFPLERIGSKTNSFRGMIKEVEITVE